MADYKLARDQRKGTAEMTIEPKHPDDPHNESLDLPDKSGLTTQGGIGEIPSIAPKVPNKAVTIPVHPGDFSRSPKYSPVTKT